MDKNNKFTCESCNETFDKGWSDDECLQEKKENFGDMPLDDMYKVCDDCYNYLMRCAKERFGI